MPPNCPAPFPQAIAARMPIMKAAFTCCMTDMRQQTARYRLRGIYFDLTLIGLVWK